MNCQFFLIKSINFPCWWYDLYDIIFTSFSAKLKIGAIFEFHNNTLCVECLIICSNMNCWTIPAYVVIPLMAVALVAGWWRAAVEVSVANLATNDIPENPFRTLRPAKVNSHSTYTHSQYYIVKTASLVFQRRWCWPSKQNLS